MLTILRLKNNAGMIREVPAGFSWAGFFLHYFMLVARGLFARAFLVLIAYFLLSLSSGAVLYPEWLKIWPDGGKLDAAVKALSAVANVLALGGVLLLSIVTGLKINKWTARYWMGRGYEPVGPGWENWGPKWGLDRTFSRAGRCSAEVVVERSWTPAVSGALFCVLCHQIRHLKRPGKVVTGLLTREDSL
jgi:hypothetical protein